MSGIEVVSLACNVMQIISYAKDTVALCKSIYQGRSPEVDLMENASLLANLSAQIQAHEQGKTAPKSSKRQLFDIAGKCNVAARALEEELRFIADHKAKGSLTSTLRVAVKTNWRKNRLEKLEKSLQNHQKTLESHLLASIYKRSDAIELQQRQGFGTLENNLQIFVSQYASGHTKLSELVKTEALSAMDHTTKESLRAEQAVKTHVSHEISAAERSINRQMDAQMKQATDVLAERARELRLQDANNDQRERLLRSLKFPAMNERRNHVTDSYEGTFAWVLHSSSDGPQQGVETKSAVDARRDGGSDDESISSDHRARFEDTPWDNFKDWLRSDSNIYWINGKPGSGKSTLVKFIISNPLTQATLNTRSDGTVIICHFFWKPGSQMQNSIKGFLCTILHQSLSHDPAVLDSLLTTSPSLESKDSDTDWSVTELRSVCLAVLRMYPSSVCIFLDGLDEIRGEDGPIDLMKLIDEMRESPKVKICVASRPEPLLRARLDRHPQLRLHDLTEDDMERYASEMLGSFWDAEQFSPRFKWMLEARLVDKAEGVFLWLHLAIRSLRNGIEHGDDEEELKKRLELLPTDLSKLYMDMWSRLNEDIVLYRQVAARYFNTIIRTQATEKYVTAGSFEPISLLQFVGATEPAIRDSVLSEQRTLEEPSSSDLCHKVRKAIQSRCAGLLDAGTTIMGEYHLWEPDYHQRLLPYARMWVNFIHRTVLDFLTDTEDGLRIRSYDSTSDDQLSLELIKGYLAEATIGRRGSFNDVGIALLSLAAVKDPDLQTSVRQLLRVCQRLYDSNYLRCDNRSYFQPMPHFLAVVSVYGFETYVLTLVEESPNPSSLATEILRETFSLWFHRTSFYTRGLAALVEGLLALNADPNQKGFTYASYPAHTPTDFVAYDTALSQLLLTASRNLPAMADDLAKVLPKFMQTGPCLQHRISFALILREHNFSIDDVEAADWFVPCESLMQLDELDKVSIVLDTSIGALVEVIIRAHHNLGEGMDCLPASVQEELSVYSNSTTTSNVAFISLTKHAGMTRSPTGLPEGKRYRLVNEEKAQRTVAILERTLRRAILRRGYLYEPNEGLHLRREIYDDIASGSDDFEEVDGFIRGHLADAGCGFRRMEQDQIDRLRREAAAAGETF